MNPPHLHYGSPQLDEGLSVVVVDGVCAGEVRTWNAGGQHAELVELHTSLETLEEASRVQIRWERPLEPTAALAGTVRIQQAFGGQLGHTRWFHLSLSRAELAPTEEELARLAHGETWSLLLEDGRGPRQVGYLFRERAGTAWIDHYLVDATYRPPHTTGSYLEIRRLDAAPGEGRGFARLTEHQQTRARYYRTACSWHRHQASASARLAC